MSDLPHRFGESLFRHVEFVAPKLDFVWFQETDATLILGASVGEIIGHGLPPFGMQRILRQESSCPLRYKQGLIACRSAMTALGQRSQAAR